MSTRTFLLLSVVAVLHAPFASAQVAAGPWNNVAPPKSGVDAIPNDRRYDQASYLTAHNAFAATAAGWAYAEQSLSIKQQLDYGVRALMLDIHKDCAEVPKQISKTEKQCKKVTRQDCQKAEKKCTKKTKSDCSKAPKGPLRDACKKITETVCESGGVICRNVDDVVCSPVTVTETVVEKLCRPDAMLCHNNCDLTRGFLKPGTLPQTLQSALSELRVFLDAHPAAVLTLQLESKVGDPTLVRRAFAGAKLTSYIYNPRGGNVPDGANDWSNSGRGHWPPLGWMRTYNKRLVVLSSSADDGADIGVQHIWPVTVETQFDLAKYSACELRGQVADNVDRPDVTLFTMNHFYAISVPAPVETAATHDYAEVNAETRLMPRIARCHKELRRLPNFLALDFVNQGDGLRVVQTLNRRTAEDWRISWR